MNDSLSRLALTALSSLVLLSSACAGEVSVTAGTTGTGAGGGGTGGGGTGGGPSMCVPQPEDPGGFQQPTCADLSVLTLGAAVVTDDGGDGKVSPGEGATITVPLMEIAGKGFSAYPGVSFTSDLALLDDPGSAQLYAILPCQVADTVTHITIPPSVAKGTLVKIEARVSMLGAECPDTSTSVVSIPIE